MAKTCGSVALFTGKEVNPPFIYNNTGESSANEDVVHVASVHCHAAKPCPPVPGLGGGNQRVQRAEGAGGPARNIRADTASGIYVRRTAALGRPLALLVGCAGLCRRGARCTVSGGADLPRHGATSEQQFITVGPAPSTPASWKFQKRQAQETAMAAKVAPLPADEMLVWGATLNGSSAAELPEDFARRREGYPIWRTVNCCGVRLPAPASLRPRCSWYGLLPRLADNLPIVTPASARHC